MCLPVQRPRHYIITSNITQANGSFMLLATRLQIPIRYPTKYIFGKKQTNKQKTPSASEGVEIRPQLIKHWVIYQVSMVFLFIIRENKGAHSLQLIVPAGQQVRSHHYCSRVQTTRTDSSGFPVLLVLLGVTPKCNGKCSSNSRAARS